LQKFLEGRPIVARPVSRVNRAWRWCRRNPVPATLTFLLALALISGTTISSWFAWKNGQLAMSETSARIVAERQRDIARGLNEFLTRDILGQADIWNQAETESSVDPNITIQATLDRSAANVATRFAGRQEIEAAVRRALGAAYTALGEHAKAIGQLEKSLDFSSKIADPTPQETQEHIEAQYLLAKSYWLSQKGAQADAAFRTCLKETIARLGANSRERLVIQTSLAFIHIGRDSEALELLKELQPIVASSFKPDDIDVLHFQNTLGLAQQQANDMAGALATFTTGHAHAQAALGEANPLTMMLLNNRARWYLINKQPAQALEIFQQLEPLVSKQLGPDNPNAILTRCNLAYCYLDNGQFEKASELLETVAPAMRAGLGPDEPRTRKAQLAWAKSLAKINKINQAATIYSELWTTGADQPPPEIIDTIVADTAGLLLNAGDKERFLQLVSAYGQALQTAPAPVDEHHAQQMEALAILLLGSGELPLAEQWIRRSLDHRMQLAAGDWRTTLTELVLAETLLASQQNEQAVYIVGRAVESLKPQIGSLSNDHRQLLVDRLVSIQSRLKSAGLPDADARVEQLLAELKSR
jgi:tetratricopeptide (TPR) repeat protein